MMEDICGGGRVLLNLTEVWQTDNPNISQCFSRTVLVLLPALIVVINFLQSFQQFVKKSRGMEKVSQERSYTILARIFLLGLLLSLKIAIIALDVLTKTEEVSPADLIYYAGSLLVLLLNLLVQLLDYRLGVFCSGLQFLYWVTHVLCFLPATKVSVERLLEASEGQLTVSALCLTPFY